jgi:predicted dehydrogenase
MYRVKIIGAGSIGNHLAHAARSKGWAVTLTDMDQAALERTRDSIYPSRYGKWDKEIILKDSATAMAEPADIVFIGTPPDTHIRLANAVLDGARPRALMI